MDKILVSVNEAAELCSVSRNIIYDRFQDGTLSQCKVGKRTLVAVDELYAWRDALKAQARVKPADEPTAVALSDYWRS